MLKFERLLSFLVFPATSVQFFFTLCAYERQNLQNRKCTAATLWLQIDAAVAYSATKGRKIIQNSQRCTKSNYFQRSALLTGSWPPDILSSSASKFWLRNDSYCKRCAQLAPGTKSAPLTGNGGRNMISMWLFPRQTNEINDVNISFILNLRIADTKHHSFKLPFFFNSSRYNSLWSSLGTR